MKFRMAVARELIPGGLLTVLYADTGATESVPCPMLLSPKPGETVLVLVGDSGVNPVVADVVRA